MIHVSTDYVFDGSKRTPYSEDDEPRPLNVYGRTKLAGDVAVEEAGIPHLIFRTSWVYSAGGRNFALAILRRARETAEAGVLRVVNDQRGAPTSADAIAVACLAVVDSLGVEQIGGAIRGRTGVYNLTAAGETTWLGFAEAILEECGVSATIEPITTEQFGAPAPRPRYSVLDNAKLRETFGVAPADWRTELARLAPALRAV